MTDWLMPSEISDALGQPGFKGPQRLTSQKVGRVLRELELVDNPEVCRSEVKELEASNTGRTFTQRYYDFGEIKEAITDKMKELWPPLMLKTGDIVLPDYLAEREKALDELPAPAPAADSTDTKWSDYQTAIFKEVKLGNGNVVVIARAGSGKCLGKGTPVLMFDGTIRPVDEIRDGDLLMSPDSKPRRVLSCSVGNGELFRINPVKGESWICNSDHVLTLTGTNRQKGRVIDVSLKDHLAACREAEEKPDRNWKLFRVPVEFDHSDLEVDPYLLGLWIGDGTRGEPQITNSDPEIISYCSSIAEKYGCELVVRHDERCNTFNLRFRVGRRGETCRNTPHLLRRFFIGCSETDEKKIPRNFLVNSSENRLRLLAGILDTDGFLQSNSFELVVKSHVLADQILFLIRSLGFAAYASDKIVETENFVRTYKRISIYGDLDRIPCQVARRQATARKQIKRHLVTGFQATSIGDGDYYGFTLDGDGRFLLGDFTVTHNTTTIVEALNYTSHDIDILLCAFNKDIQTELEKRAPSHVKVRTVHSLGFEICRKHFGRTSKTLGGGKSMIDKFKVFNLIDEVLRSAGGKVKYKKLSDAVDLRTGNTVPGGGYKSARMALSKLVSLCKNTLSIRQAERLRLYFEYNIGDTGKADLMCQAAGEVLKRNDDITDRIDYDDMIYFPWRHNLSLGNMQFDMVMVDEAQDLNAAQLWFIKTMCRTDGRIVALGDDRQCQPHGTLVSVPGGKTKPIQDLKDGDAVVAWDRRNRSLVGRNKELYEIKVASRPYEGDLISVRSGNNKTRCTPNHKWTVKTSRRTGLWVVYLMRKGSKFRIGWCQLFDKNSSLHLATRTRLEKADSAWILSVHNSKRDVSLEENLVSHRFNIPLVQFTQSIASPNAGLASQDYLDEFWEAIGLQEDNARKCLNDHGREYEFPFYTNAKRGRTTVMEVVASNLFHEFMLVPVDVGTNVPTWTEFSTRREFYAGDVFSLDVSKYGHYVADGIITHNSIYGFRGADRQAIPKLIEGLNAQTLPLSVSYRCARAIVGLAQSVVPDIQWAPDAPEGIIGSCDIVQVMNEAKPGDFILSRINAPLACICMSFLKRGIPAIISGRDIGKQIDDLIRRASAGTLPELFSWLEKWLEKERKDSLPDRAAHYYACVDKSEVIRYIANMAGSVSKLIVKVNEMFSDDTPRAKIVCSTVHKAKGMERDRVWMLQDTFKPNANVEEANIWYVSVTRAKRELYLCETPAKEIMSWI